MSSLHIRPFAFSDADYVAKTALQKAVNPAATSTVDKLKFWDQWWDPKFRRAIFTEIPDALKTRRLLLRGPLPEDAQEFHIAITESLPALRPWFWWAEPPPTLASNAAFIAESHRGFGARRQMDWLLFLQESQVFIGVVSMHSRHRGTVDWAEPTQLLSYWLRTGYTGQGYMTEAVAAVVDLVFSLPVITSLEIHCNIANEPSAALAERLGFDYWKMIPDGDTWDHVYVKEKRTSA